jgi:hypothetical protein
MVLLQGKEMKKIEVQVSLDILWGTGLRTPPHTITKTKEYTSPLHKMAASYLHKTWEHPLVDFKPSLAEYTTSYNVTAVHITVTLHSLENEKKKDCM